MSDIFDDRPRPQADKHVLGQDLTDLSIDELAEWIEALKKEMIRLEETRAKKMAVRDAAASLFGR
jgi:uncharacterized small protein (DUF1192 family)